MIITLLYTLRILTNFLASVWHNIGDVVLPKYEELTRSLTLS